MALHNSSARIIISLSSPISEAASQVRMEAPVNEVFGGEKYLDTAWREVEEKLELKKGTFRKRIQRPIHSQTSQWVLSLTSND